MAKNITDFADYSIKNLKSFMGMEGYGFNVNLYRGKKKVAFVIDEGNGGMINIDWLLNEQPLDWNDKKACDKWHNDKQEEMERLEKHCATLPILDTSIPNFTLTVDCELFISELVNKFEKEKDLIKMMKKCKTVTCFRPNNYTDGSYLVIGCPCDDKMRQQLHTKYGDDVEIFNDVLAEGRKPSIFCEEEMA